MFDHNWDAVRRLMWDLVGIVRSDQRLLYAERLLALLREEIERDYVRLRLSRDLVELRNIALVGGLIVECARRRSESRGLHFNLDHPRRERRYDGRPTVLRRRAPAPAPPCRSDGAQPIVPGRRSHERPAAADGSVGPGRGPGRDGV